MLPGTATTFAISSPPPFAAGFTTLAAVGQTVLRLASESSPHDSAPFSVGSGAELTRFRKRLKMCVVPDWSKRTMGVIGSLAHPAPVSVSPPPVMSLQVLSVPAKMPSSTASVNASLPAALVLVAVQPLGRWTRITTDSCATGIVSTTFGVLVDSLASSSVSCFSFGGSSVPTNALPTPKDTSVGLFGSMSHERRPAPLPVEVYVTVGAFLSPCVPLQARVSAEVWNVGPHSSCGATACSVEPWPVMLAPEHCGPTVAVALAALGSARAAIVAAETTHAEAMRRADRDFMSLLPPDQQVDGRSRSLLRCTTMTESICAPRSTLLTAGVDKVASG